MPLAPPMPSTAQPKPAEQNSGLNPPNVGGPLQGTTQGVDQQQRPYFPRGIAVGLNNGASMGLPARPANPMPLLGGSNPDRPIHPFIQYIMQRQGGGGMNNGGGGDISGILLQLLSGIGGQNAYR